jgi:predicted Zn-dependent protease
MLAALAVAALLGIAIWMFASRVLAPLPHDAPLPPADKSLISAVLPAATEAGSEVAWMRLGVMDIVASRLRSSGLPSVPSEDVVVLLKAPAANRSATLREATGAALLVSPRAHRMDTQWQVELEADDGAGQHYAVDGRARDVAEAARNAADKLLTALGRRPAATALEAAPHEDLIRRVDAAVLADDPDAARALIAQASAEAQQSPELRLRLAKIDFRAGRLDAAHARLVALLDEAPAKTSPVLRASVLNGLGAVAIRSDHPQQAAEVFEEAIGLLEARAEPAQLGQAYLGRAAAAADQRHFAAAAADYARARIALRQANDTLALVRVAANEGFLDLDQGRPAQALPQLVSATEGFKQWGALNEAILTYTGQIGCYLALLDGRAAMLAADAADALAQRIDNPSTLASLTIARAKALAAVGRLREARDTLDRLRSTNPDSTTAAAASVVLARLEMDSNNARAAGDLAERSVIVLDAPGYAGLRADAWLTQIRSLLNNADSARASAAIAGFETWAAQADDPRAALFARLARAEYARRFDDGKSWRAAFDTARELAARDAVPAEIAAVAKSYADALFAAGDLDTAAVEVGRVSRWSEQDFACAVLEARLYAALGRDEARQTALARARTLAGERSIPADARATPVSTRAASAQ